MVNKKPKSYKFSHKVDKGFLLGYVSNSHAYHVFNKINGCAEIARDVMFDEPNGSKEGQVANEIIDDEEAPTIAIKKMTLGEIKPQNNQEPPSMTT